MNKILAGILSFFLWLMPWWTGLYDLRERVAFDRNAIMSKIATYVKSRDVANLASMMRPWFKDNVLDLTDKLQDFYDAIDGNIESVHIGTGLGSRDNGGVHSESLRFGVYTDDETYPYYYLLMWYDVSSSKNRNDVGIGMIELATGKTTDPEAMIHFVLKAPEWN